MKRIAGLAALVVLAASACSDSPTSPGDQAKPPALNGSLSAEAKAAMARTRGLDPSVGSSTTLDNKQYLAVMPPFWISNLGTNLVQGDDDCDFVSFAFPFQFFGRTYTGVWINSNGNLTFDGCFTSFSPTNLPAGSHPIVAGLFSDWEPDVGGPGSGVFFSVIGTPPARRLVVTYNAVPAYSLGGSNTHQIQLLERLNVIIFSYGAMTTNGINWTGSNLTAGISSGGFSGLGGFPGLNIVATGTQVPALVGHSFCLIPLGGAYRLFNDLICSLFVF